MHKDELVVFLPSHDCVFYTLYNVNGHSHFMDHVFLCCNSFYIVPPSSHPNTRINFILFELQSDFVLTKTNPNLIDSSRTHFNMLSRVLKRKSKGIFSMIKRLNEEFKRQFPERPN
jgi:hypothetical protein